MLSIYPCNPWNRAWRQYIFPSARLNVVSISCVFSLFFVSVYRPTSTRMLSVYFDTPSARILSVYITCLFSIMCHHILLTFARSIRTSVRKIYCSLLHGGIYTAVNQKKKIKMHLKIFIPCTDCMSMDWAPLCQHNHGCTVFHTKSTHKNNWKTTLGGKMW